ncbi:hypothetical protein LINPERHAP1_LOCUS18013, partial [Linum perenne]
LFRLRRRGFTKPPRRFHQASDGDGDANPNDAAKSPSRFHQGGNGGETPHSDSDETPHGDGGENPHDDKTPHGDCDETPLADFHQVVMNMMQF